MTRGASTPSAGSAGIKCRSPTGIETSRVSRTRVNELGQMQRGDRSLSGYQSTKTFQDLLAQSPGEIIQTVITQSFRRDFGS